MSGIVLLALRLAMALALYAFLGWVLWTLWTDMRQQSLWMASYRVPVICLSYSTVHGSKVLELRTPEGIIGRNPTADLHLNDETVSARHARLSFHHAQWWIEDLNSRNGTYLNGQMVTEPVVITSGDELRCGQVVMTVHIH